MIEFRRADYSDVVKLKKLWADCFDEAEQAVKLIFDEYFDMLFAYCAEENGEILAAVYLTPSSLNGRQAHYLCGASTAERYRGRGIMSRLIKFALSDAESRGDAYSLLFPANEGLYEFYKRLGYAPACKSKAVSLSRSELAKVKISSVKTENEMSLENLQKACLKSNYLHYGEEFMSFAAEYYKIYGVKTVRGKSSFALVDEQENQAYVIYSLYTDFEELKTLLLDGFSAKRFVFTVKPEAELYGGGAEKDSGMILPLDKNAAIPDNAFIGINLN